MGEEEPKPRLKPDWAALAKGRLRGEPTIRKLATFTIGQCADLKAMSHATGASESEIIRYAVAKAAEEWKEEE